MKRKLSRFLIAGIIACSIAGATPVMAATTTTEPEITATVQEEIIGTRADKFETHFRTFNGIWQYRIWNATRARWENDWTDL